MLAWIRLVGPNHVVELFGIRLVGADMAAGKKLLFTLGLIAIVIGLNFLLRGLFRLILAGRQMERVRFWVRQGVRLLLAIVFVVGIVSIWFNEGSNLGTFLGLVTAGVAFALQRVITAFAAYIVILRGKTFNVGDRIVMGGVRGDVIGLGFMQTRIMEMGQPPSVNSEADPAVWVRARQYTGRVVVITNDKIFDTPVYNYTLDFPYIWDEMRIPISYKDDRRRAEQILLEAAAAHAVHPEDIPAEALAEMERRFALRPAEVRPKVYYRLTDNWIELSVRFICLDHHVRDVKDAMSRQIIDAFDEAGIGIASGTYDIVGLPPLRIEHVAPVAVKYDEDGKDGNDWRDGREEKDGHGHQANGESDGRA